MNKFILDHTDATKDELKKTGVYLIEHLSKPSIYYIGSTIDKRGFYKRFQHHYSNLKNNKHSSKYLNNVVKKYGLDNLRFYILDIVDSDFCLSIEQ